MSRSKRSKEEEIQHLKKKLRKLEERNTGTVISITGEYENPESGASRSELSARKDSDHVVHHTAKETTVRITPPAAPKESQARSELRTNLDAHSTQNELQMNLNTTEAHSSRSELIRTNLNAMEAHSSRTERPENSKAIEANNSRSESRANSNTTEVHSSRSELIRTNLNVMEAHSSQAERPENLKVIEANNVRSESRANSNTMEVHSSRSEPRPNINALERNSSRIEPRTTFNIFERYSSRNEPRVKFSCIEVNSPRSDLQTNLNVIEAHSSRHESRTTFDDEGEPQANLNSTDAHISSTPLRPQSSSEVKISKKNPARPRKSFDASEVNSSKNKKRTSSETSLADNSSHSDNDGLLSRKESLLKALGDDLSLSGELIHESLAQTWSTILRKGLADDVKEKLLKEYAAPENCKVLKAPTLNEEVAAVIEFQARNRDRILENKQNQLGLGITAIGRAITVLLNSGDNSEFNAMKHFNHGCRILLDLHHTETNSRRHLFKKDLNRSDVFRNLRIQNLERDDTLYGNKVTKMVKKQGIPTTPVHPRPSSSSYGDPTLPNRVRNAIDLNQARDGESPRYRRI